MEPTVTIRNGDKVAGTFSVEEMERRLARLRDHMAEAGIDAALFTSYHNINYYGDFLYCAFGRPFGLIVTGESSTTVTANVDGGQPWRRSFGDNLVYTDWQRDNYFRAVTGLIGDRAVVGVEHDHMALQTMAKLEAALPGATFVDIGVAAMRLRVVKSAEEIALIR